MTTENETLTMPRFDKVRYQHWQLDQMKANPLQEHQIASCFAKEGEDGIEISGNTVTYHHLSKELKKAGVLVLALRDARVRYPELVALVDQQTMTKANQLTDLNVKQENTGIFVYIPAHVKLADSLHLYLNHLVETGDMAARILVYVAADAQAKVELNLKTIGQEKAKLSVVAEIIAEKNSKLKMIGFDDFAKESNGYINRQALVKDQATVDFVQASFNDGNVISQMTSRLVGEASKSDAKVAAFTNHRQTQGFNTEIQNIGRHTVGHIYQRGVILDSSTLVFNGLGKIIKGAKGSDANQESRVLMLSKRARGEANPLLLIDESDVTAGHAASVGQVDQNQLYYLMSRGLPKVVARRLVVRGFVGEVLSQLDDSRMRERVIEKIERKLTDGVNKR